MIRNMISGALRGAKAALAAGESGWEVVLGSEQGLTGFGVQSDAGTTVSPESIMQLSTVWACMSRTSQMISTLPGAIYARSAGDSRTKVVDQLADILTVSPNADQTAAEFWEGMTAQQMIRGNAFAEKQFIGTRLVGLKPLLNCTVCRTSNGTLEYTVRDRGKSVTLPPQKVFHVRGFGVGEGIGLSAVRYGVQSFGAALAADKSAAAVFANGMFPSGIVEAEQTLSPDQREQLQTLVSDFVGSNKQGKILTLEAGLSYNQMSLNPEDAQLLQTRGFAVEDICRWFGVPPIIIGHAASGQTMWGTGVEAIMLSWLTTGINPLLRKIEARILKDLIPQSQRRNWYFEFNREAMLQMDSGAKGEFMSKMGASGTMTANERRARLNLPRSEDPNADRLLAQTALAPLADLGGNTK